MNLTHVWSVVNLLAKMIQFLEKKWTTYEKLSTLVQELTNMKGLNDETQLDK